MVFYLPYYWNIRYVVLSFAEIKTHYCYFGCLCKYIGLTDKSPLPSFFRLFFFFALHPSYSCPFGLANASPISVEIELLQQGALALSRIQAA